MKWETVPADSGNIGWKERTAMARHKTLSALATIMAMWSGICEAQEHPGYPARNVGLQGQYRSVQPPGNTSQLGSFQQAAYLTQPEAPGLQGPFVGPTKVVSLVQYALSSNPEIQAVRYKAAALGARVPQVKSLPDPQLLTTVFLEEIQTAAGPQQVAMTLAQKFPWFGKLALRSQVAYQDSMATYARVASTELKVIEQVKRAYYDLYYVQSAAAETRKLQQPLKDVIQIASAKYESSVARAGLESVLQAQVELARLEATLVGLEESALDAQAKLAGVLHLPAQTQIEAVRTVHRTDLAHTAGTLVGLVESCQPELEAWRHEVNRDRSSINVACREYWPDVKLGASWYEMGDRGLSPVANGRDAFSLGVGVSLPIYRNRLDAAVREAQYNASSSTRKYQAARDQFESDVQGLYARFREQDRVIKILETKIIPPAEQTLELSTESYRLGTLSFEQLIDAYRTLLTVRIDYHKRVALREQVVASLERAVGCGIASGPHQAAPASAPQLAPLPPTVQ
jgi:outer membrane protein, heavy metal efflux system